MKVEFGRGNLDQGPAGPKAVTVGVFDGVHRGHVKILRCLCRVAREQRCLSAVVTFETHPTRAFPQREQVFHLTCLAHKLMFLERAGVDICYVIDFSPAFAAVAPETFVRNMLVKKIGMRALVVGEDFVFGKNARGDVRLLRVLSRQEKFLFCAVRHLKVKGRIVSSTRIRRLIGRGDLDQARQLLGRPVSVLGDVVAGEKRGRTLGFPTANVEPRHEVLVPDGIYAARALCARRRHDGVAYVGRRPTFFKGSAPRSVEVFLFDFARSLYGQTLEVEFFRKIRPDRKFPDSSSLAAQIKQDVRAAKKILKSFS